ncbi:MAG: DUF2800 domain-containing protein [Gammaproteobacteria bacterium]|nr:DUF2800 domain-containing protein [Gammaproteobacteria bacterium]
MTAHAKLGASGSATWMNCPASIRICEDLPEDESPFAAEGTEAHDIAEKCLKTGENAPDTHPELQMYLDYVRETTGALQVEVQVAYDEWVPEGFGTVDALIIHEGKAHVTDLKWGKGVQVSADNNTQLMLYALGALQKYQFEYEIDELVLTIIQPRLDHISEWTISTEELLKWADEVVLPAALATEDPAAAVVPTPKGCRWCKARAICRERVRQLLALPDQPVDRLTRQEVADLLPVAEAAKVWASELQAYALKTVEQGETLPSYKLVAGKANRKFKADAEETLREAGLDDDVIYRKSFNTLGAIEKALGGKKKAKSVMDEVTIKPAGKPALVKLDDPRPELNAATIDDFPTGE